MESEANKILDEVTQSEYKYGFVTDIETEFAPKGITEATIRYISAKKNEPDFLLDFRLKAFRHWLTMKQPTWAHLKIEPIDFQNIIYYAAPKRKKELESLGVNFRVIRGKGKVRMMNAISAVESALIGH